MLNYGQVTPSTYWHYKIPVSATPPWSEQRFQDLTAFQSSAYLYQGKITLLTIQYFVVSGALILEDSFRPGDLSPRNLALMSSILIVLHPFLGGSTAKGYKRKDDQVWSCDILN